MRCAPGLVLGLAIGCALPAAAGAAPFQPVFAAPATLAANRQEALTSLRLAVGPILDGAMQTRLAEGALDQTAWRIAAPGQTTLQLLAPLRDQLAAAGWRTIYDCETEACGGFDFRYGIDVMPEPDMHVDLSDFRYLAAERGTGRAAQVVSILVSRSAETGFVQVTQIGATLPAAVAVADEPGAAPTDTPADAPIDPGPDAEPATVAVTEDAATLGQRLESGGAVALDDLVFASGSAVLAAGRYATLDALAAWLAVDAGRRVALVGHTDASGGLEANVALSRRRAQAVRDRLIAEHGVRRDQLAAEGVGYLAPRADNLTDLGRTRNRRVEVVLTSTP